MAVHFTPAYKHTVKPARNTILSLLFKQLSTNIYLKIGNTQSTQKSVQCV